MKKENDEIKKSIEKVLGVTSPDPVIEIIKGMHCDPKREKFYDLPADERNEIKWGILKDEACEDLGISPRKFQNIINGLDKNNHSEPGIYICGQPVKVEIVEERIDHKKLKKKQKEWYKNSYPDDTCIEVDEEINVDRRTRFCTPNSMHPIFLQLNVSQLATLMGALAHYANEMNVNSPVVLGEYILSQLSDYGRQRVENTYAKQDPLLQEFLCEIDELPENEVISSFHSDEEFYENLDGTYADMLNLCCKNEELCDIELEIKGERKSYRDVHITFSEKGYELIPDGDKRLEFGIENVVSAQIKKH